MKSLVKFEACLCLAMVSMFSIGLEAQESQQSPIKITEIQYYGSVGVSDSSVSEPGMVNRWDKWIELSNVTANTVDLAGYTLNFGAGISEYHTFEFVTASIRPRASLVIGMDRTDLTSAVNANFRSSTLKNMSRTTEERFTQVSLSNGSKIVDAVNWGESQMSGFEKLFLDRNTQYSSADIWQTVSFSISNSNGSWAPARTAFNGSNYGTPGSAIIPVMETITEPIQQEPITVSKPIVVPQPIVKPSTTPVQNTPQIKPQPAQKPRKQAQPAQRSSTAPSTVKPAQGILQNSQEVLQQNTEILAEQEVSQKSMQDITLSAIQTAIEPNTVVSPANFVNTSSIQTATTVKALEYELDLPWRSVMYGSLSIALLALSQLVGWNIRFSEYNQVEEADVFI